MAKIKRIFTDEERNKKILKEKKKLSIITKDMSPEQKIVTGPLIDNIAFCVVQLEEVKEMLNRDGFYERYKNGKNQYGNKESITSKQFINLGKLHTVLLNRLKDFIPDGSHGKDELEKFQKKYNKS